MNDTLMHAAKAVEAVLVDMTTGQFARRNDGMDFEDYKRLVGFDDWVAIDGQFAEAPPFPARHCEACAAM